MNFVRKNLFVLLLFTLIGCGNSNNRKEEQVRSSQMSLERRIEINKKIVAHEQKVIHEYAEENNLDMNTTKTGLWYKIIEQGTGEYIKAGKVVSLKYEISLLDGTVCYSSEDDGLKFFLVGQGGVESGLEEGVLLLKKGGKARFIMPPHLAHGLIGDGDQIPGRAILQYEVEIVDVKNKEEN